MTPFFTRKLDNLSREGAKQVSYPALTLFYMTDEGEREVFFFTIEAAAQTLARLHVLGLKVSLYFKGEVILGRREPCETGKPNPITTR